MTLDQAREVVNFFTRVQPEHPGRFSAHLMQGPSNDYGVMVQEYGKHLATLHTYDEYRQLRQQQDL